MANVRPAQPDGVFEGCPDRVLGAGLSGLPRASCVEGGDTTAASFLNANALWATTTAAEGPPAPVASHPGPRPPRRPPTAAGSAAWTGILHALLVSTREGRDAESWGRITSPNP